MRRHGLDRHQTLFGCDGVLTGKKTGRAVEATLRTHGGLAPADAAEVAKSLVRVKGEVDAK